MIGPYIYYIRITLQVSRATQEFGSQTVTYEECLFLSDHCQVEKELQQVCILFSDCVMNVHAYVIKYCDIVLLVKKLYNSIINTTLFVNG